MLFNVNKSYIFAYLIPNKSYFFTYFIKFHSNSEQYIFTARFLIIVWCCCVPCGKNVYNQAHIVYSQFITICKRMKVGNKNTPTRFIK